MPPSSRASAGRAPSGERGAGSAEYAGIVVVVVLLVAALAPVSAPAARAVGERISCAVSSLDVGVGSCAAAVETADGTGGGADGGDAAAGEPTGTDDEDRGDTARDARGDRRDRGRGDETQPKDGDPGPAPQDGGLGAPVPGESAPVPPEPAWQPVDDGAGEHDSEDAGLRDRATEFAAEAAANAMSGRWPDASRNLLHFLGNSGEPLAQDVDGMLGDLPEFAAAVEQDRRDLAALAVERARAAGATGPLSFPVGTAWTGFGYDESGLVYDDSNWFYALGGWQYSLTGQVTVWPPAAPGGAWRYEVSTATNMKDQYNWDGSKATQIGPFEVTDAQLAELHRKGLAQEFTAYGRSSQTRTEGTIP